MVFLLSNRVHHRVAKRLLLPAFVSLGLSFTFANASDVISSIFVMESFDSLPEGVREPLLVAMPLFFIMLLLASFISIVFAPAWLLEDIGIICERKTTGATADIMGVGNWYLTLFKGFAGISTLLAYFFISVDMIMWFLNLPGYGVEIPIWLFLIPVVVVVISPLIALAPISVVYIFYLTSFSRKLSNLEKEFESKGLREVSVDINIVGDE